MSQSVHHDDFERIKEIFPYGQEFDGVTEFQFHPDTALMLRPYLEGYLQNSPYSIVKDGYCFEPSGYGTIDVLACLTTNIPFAFFTKLP